MLQSPRTRDRCGAVLAAVHTLPACGLVVLLARERGGSGTAWFVAGALTGLFCAMLAAWCGAALVLRLRAPSRCTGGSLLGATARLAPWLFWALDCGASASSGVVVWVGLRFFASDLLTSLCLIWGAVLTYGAAVAVAELLLWRAPRAAGS
jgi:hypothetical protein